MGTFLHRARRGLTFTANYTWAKSIDDASSAGGDKNILTPVGGQTDGQIAFGGTRNRVEGDTFVTQYASSNLLARWILRQDGRVGRGQRVHGRRMFVVGLMAGLLRILHGLVPVAHGVLRVRRERPCVVVRSAREIRRTAHHFFEIRERGFRTTQATISRDVAELGLVKAGRGGTHAYAIPPRLREAETSGEERIRALIHDLPVEIREAGTLLVMRPLPGSAHPLAAAVDRARWPEVVGTIAGDDTVFLAFADKGGLGRVRRRLEQLAE